MSWLGRLFGGTPPPPPNSVIIPEAFAVRLTADGTALDAAVAKILSEYFDAVDNPPVIEKPGIPFWLQRDTANSEIEDELRERVHQRHVEEQHS